MQDDMQCMSTFIRGTHILVMVSTNIVGRTVASTVPDAKCKTRLESVQELGPVKSSSPF
jgi:hypothetical protein